MAELLISQTELDQYLDTIDLTDPTVNRVFNSVQLLTPDLYNQVLYFLVIGKLTVQRLAEVSINNASIKVLADSLEGDDESVLAMKRVYRKFQDSLPVYNKFIERMNATAPQFFYRAALPNTTYITSISLDKTGMDKTKFSGLFDAKMRYNAIVKKSRLQPEYVALAEYATANGYGRLVELLDGEINAFKLLTIKDTPVRNQISFNDSIVGYILRGVYTDPFRVNFVENLDYAVMRMVDKFGEDVSKTGVPGIRASWDSHTWASVFDSTTSAEFIEKLGVVAYLRYVIPYLYGTLYFTAEEIAAESTIHDRIVSGDKSGSGLLDLAYQYLMKLAVLVRVGMSPTAEI
jgi:hypothetical protein